MVLAWLLIRFFERVNGRRRDAVSAYLDSFSVGMAFGLGLTAGVVAQHAASVPSLAALDLLLLGPGAGVTARLLGPPSNNSFRWLNSSMAIPGLLNGMLGAGIGLLIESRNQHARHRETGGHQTV